MVDHFESVSQRLGRDPDDPLERPAQVQDRLDRPRNGERTKEQHHRYGHVRGANRPKLMKSRHSQNKTTNNTGTGIPSTSCSIKSQRTSAMSLVSAWACDSIQRCCALWPSIAASRSCSSSNRTMVLGFSSTGLALPCGKRSCSFIDV